MEFIKAAFLVLSSIYFVAAASHKSTLTCTIPLDTGKDYHFRRPLVFTKGGELFERASDGNVLQTPDQEEIVFSCAPNYLKNFFRNGTMTVKCDASENRFVMKDGKSSPISEYSCDLRVIEEVFTPVEGCSNPEWKTSQFGFIHPKDEQSVLIGESCYDTLGGSTLFAHVKLGKDNFYLAKKDKKFFVQNHHPDFRYKIELFRKLDFDEIYRRMEHDLSSKKFIPLVLNNFIDDNLLSNGQFRQVRKLGWNYFIRAEEQKSLEKVKHSIQALSAGMELDVYTGGYGVATFYGGDDKKLEVFLDSENNRFPMPKIVWFLVKSATKSIAVAVYNNKQEVNHTQDEHLCQSQCDKVTWLQKLSALGNDVFCCSYEDLRKTLPDLPMITIETNELLL